MPSYPALLPRFLASRLPAAGGPRRLVVLTGARQVGKTTLARAVYGEALRYLSLDSPGERARLRQVDAEAWARAVGPALLDEAQKEPSIFEKVKWAYDAGELDFSVLLGSSRILLLDRVRETLAGRVFLYELWPLAAAELVPFFGGGALEEPLLLRLARALPDAAALLDAASRGVTGPEVGHARAALEHLLVWGGLPTLLHYQPHERLAWLEAYQATYLERDLADLVRLRDLETFTTCHRLAAARAGSLLSYSDLARDAGVPVTTVRRYLRYLELSYQSLRLEAWAGNPGVRLVKSPKLMWVDAGVQRVLSGQLRGLTGAQYESSIVTQILVTLRSCGERTRLSYLRTGGGLEVDLVLEDQDDLLAIEVKARRRAGRPDATPIERARRLFGGKYRGGVVIYRGDRVVKLSETVYAVPDWLLLGHPGPAER